LASACQPASKEQACPHVNGAYGKIVETNPAGQQVFHKFLDATPPSPLGAGALFGLAVRPDLGGVYYVDDVANTLRLLH